MFTFTSLIYFIGTIYYVVCGPIQVIENIYGVIILTVNIHYNTKLTF